MLRRTNVVYKNAGVVRHAQYLYKNAGVVRHAQYRRRGSIKIIAKYFFTLFNLNSIAKFNECRTLRSRIAGGVQISWGSNIFVKYNKRGGAKT